MGEEALHFALALQHEGLLACATSGAEAAVDGMALERHGTLLLALTRTLTRTRTQTLTLALALALT